MKKQMLLLTLVTTIISCSSIDMEHQRKIADDTKELGVAYFLQGDYTRALKEFLEAEKTIPDDPYLQNNLGLAFMGKKRYQTAEVHFRKAVTLKPDYVPAKNNLGSAYMKQEKWDLAIDCFQEISGSLLYATPHFPLSNLGWAYLGKKEYSRARDYFNRALKIKLDFINALHGLATTHLDAHQPGIAQSILARAIKKNPEVAVLHADMARTYEALGQPEKAKESWETVMGLAPGSELAREAESHLY